MTPDDITPEHLKILNDAITAGNGLGICLAAALVFVTLLVVAGLFIEYRPAIKELCSLYKFRHALSIRSEYRKLRVETTGGIIVTIAIFAELILQGVIIWNDISLRKENDSRELMLTTELSIASKHASGRLVTSSDSIKFVDFINLPNQHLKIVVLKYDVEAAVFALNLRQYLSGIKHWDIEVQYVDQDKLGIPLGMIGPFGGDDKILDVHISKADLYSVMFGLGFCISLVVPHALQQFVDPDPAHLTLVIGAQNRWDPNCT